MGEGGHVTGAVQRTPAHRHTHPRHVGLHTQGSKGVSGVEGRIERTGLETLMCVCSGLILVGLVCVFSVCVVSVCTWTMSIMLSVSRTLRVTWPLPLPLGSNKNSSLPSFCKHPYTRGRGEERSEKAGRHMTRALSSVTSTHKDWICVPVLRTLSVGSFWLLVSTRMLKVR